MKGNDININDFKKIIVEAVIEVFEHLEKKKILEKQNTRTLDESIFIDTNSRLPLP